MEKKDLLKISDAEIIAQIGFSTALIGKRGYDIIKDCFFVELAEPTDTAMHWKKIDFASFRNFFKFLKGQVYDNSSYYLCPLERINMVWSKRKKEKLLENNSPFISMNLETWEEKKREIPTIPQTLQSKNKQKLKNEIQKLKEIDESSKLEQQISKIMEKSFNDVKFDMFSCLIGEYALATITDSKKSAALLKYLSEKESADWEYRKYIKGISLIYPISVIEENYHYTTGVKSTQDKHKKNILNFAKDFQSGKIEVEQKIVYNPEFDIFIKTISTHQGRYSKIYYNFDEMMNGENQHLENCDFRKWYTIDESMKVLNSRPDILLPLHIAESIRLEKEIIYKDDTFQMTLRMADKYGKVYVSAGHTFKYFVDIVHFFNGDFSDANLLYCDGIANIKDLEKYNFTNAILPLKFNHLNSLAPELNTTSYPQSEENEKETEAALNVIRDELIEYTNTDEYEKIYYISDIHIEHKLHNRYKKKEITKAEAIIAIREMAKELISSADEYSNIIICGDTANWFDNLKIFIEALKEYKYLKCINIFFVMGNHEFYDAGLGEADIIIEKIRKLLKENDIHFLHNNLYYKKRLSPYWLSTSEISEEQLINMSQEELKKIVQYSPFVIFGGVGYAQYEPNFNAWQGIYGAALMPDEEKVYGQNFETLYNKIAVTLANKPVVVATHMPLNCWKREPEYLKNFVYISGHTHRNAFHDDGEIRIYADNQKGYHVKNTKLKHLYMSANVNPFEDVTDGIIEISKEEYIDFYRSQKQNIAFTREGYKINMLKNNGCYCFIANNVKGNLYILNGGQINKLSGTDLSYYYNLLPIVMKNTYASVEPYFKKQEEISDFVKDFGGSGHIHGCIIDIDFFNHLYINPHDGSVTPYFAHNIIYKITYPNVETLLKNHAPELLPQYNACVKGSNFKETGLITRSKRKPAAYLSTDIYAASRFVNKLQKMKKNILVAWPTSLPINIAIGGTDGIESRQVKSLPGDLK